MRKTLLLAVALTAFIAVLGISAPEAMQDQRNRGKGRVSGEVIIKDVGPMLGGTIFFIDEASGIPPAPEKYWAVPAYVFPIDPFARFSAYLPEGTYYVGIVERSARESIGPPEEGEYFFLARDGKGSPRKLSVWKNAVIDLGRLDDAAPYKRPAPAKKGITAIEGRIADVHGNPVPGMIVAAYSDPQMEGKPVFVSARSDSSGRYLLGLNSGGKYYLITRSGFGGPTASEELIGVYKEGKSVVVKPNAVKKGVDFVVWPANMYE